MKAKCKVYQMLHTDPLSIGPENAQLNTSETSAIFKLITQNIKMRTLSQFQKPDVRF